MDCNAFESYKKNSDPYKKSCCPNMKREAKKWAKIKYKRSVWVLKTCCGKCVDRIQKSVRNPDDKLYEIKSTKKHTLLMKWNRKESKYQPVFRLQTISQVKSKDPDAQFRN